MAIADNARISGGDGRSDALAPTLGDLVRSGEISVSDVKAAVETLLSDSAPLKLKDGLYISLSEQEVPEDIKDTLVEFLLSLAV